MVDQLAVANWMFATVNRDEDTDPAPYPEPLPRPEGNATDLAGTAPAQEADLVRAENPHSATPAEIVAFLNAP